MGYVPTYDGHTTNEGLEHFKLAQNNHEYTTNEMTRTFLVTQQSQVHIQLWQ